MKEEKAPEQSIAALKPILYGGYKLPSEQTVINRIDCELLTDVYLLSDDSYLYLFRQLKPDSIKNTNADVSILDVERETYLVHCDKRYYKYYLADFINSLNETRGFAAVAGMKTLKDEFTKDVINPLGQKERYDKFKINLPNGVMLYGPPGCGKTYIARKLAEEIGYNFVELKPSDIGGTYIHETARNTRRIFDEARAQSPSVVFIDELEAMLPKRGSLSKEESYRREEINEFLTQLNDAGKQDILVVAATNHPELLDTAILRAGRMDKKFYVSPPDLEARIALFTMYLEERPLDNVDFEWIAEATEGYSSADIELLCEEAARQAVAQNLDNITTDLLQEVIAQNPSSITSEDIKKSMAFMSK